VITGNVVPGNADLADNAVVAIVEREVVEHDIAGRDAKGRAAANQRVHHIGADEIDRGRALRMRIGEQQDVEPARLVRLRQCEIDRAGQRTGRVDAAKAQPRRRAVGLMNVIEARQHRAAIDGQRVAGRLDHENDRLIIHRQRVTAVAIGPSDIAPVRHEHAGNAGIVGLARAGLRPVLEDDACDRVLIVARWKAGAGRTYGRKCDRRCTAFDDISPCDPMVIHRRSSKGKEGGDSLWNYARMTTCGLLACNIEAAAFMGESQQTLPRASDNRSTLMRQLDESHTSVYRWHPG
jgi:hypothetical protein